MVPDRDWVLFTLAITLTLVIQTLSSSVLSKTYRSVHFFLPHSMQSTKLFVQFYGAELDLLLCRGLQVRAASQEYPL